MCLGFCAAAVVQGVLALRLSEGAGEDLLVVVSAGVLVVFGGFAAMGIIGYFRYPDAVVIDEESVRYSSASMGTTELRLRDIDVVTTDTYGGVLFLSVRTKHPARVRSRRTFLQSALYRRNVRVTGAAITIGATDINEPLEAVYELLTASHSRPS